MRSILISIKPEWVEKILNGKKTIEIRKSKPKCELPCKVYIYCTQGQELWGDGTGNTWHGIAEDEDLYRVFELNPTLARLNGKVVAEFILKHFNKFDYEGLMFYEMKDIILKQSCLTDSELKKYVKNQICYAWHIDNLIIYDKPKELSEFKKDLDCDDYPCNKGKFCEYDYYDYCEGCKACAIDFDGTHCIYKQLKRPPESWCYVEGE